MGSEKEKNRSGEHRADHDCGPRIDALEKRVDNLEASDKEKEKKLQAGELVFLDLRKDVGFLTTSVAELSDTIKGAVRWVLGIVGTTAVGAIVWALAESMKGGK